MNLGGGLLVRAAWERRPEGLSYFHSTLHCE